MLRINRRPKMAHWLLASAAFLQAGAVLAQSPAPGASQSVAQHAFNIPVEPLSQAALRFSDQAGLQVVFSASVVEGLRSAPVTGRMTIAEAIGRLLAGSGLTWRYLNAHTITLERSVAPAPSGVRTFGVVRVEGTQAVGSNGFASLNGFGAGAGANGSSDVTATENTHSFTTNATSVSSKTPQSLQETAQTVTTLTQERIQQQDLTDLNSALAYTPGVTLDYTSSSVNASFISRGYTINTFTTDGGAPTQYNYSQDNSQRTPDLSEYDHIEVLRGSDALYGGDGNPGGVINLQRKLPLDHNQLVVDGQYGSFNNGRVEVDATGPIAFDGHVRARFDGVYQSNDYFYDVAHQTLAHLYGVVEADLGSNTIARVGGSYGHSTIPGYNPSGLPRYEDGADLGLPRSTCLCATWNQYDDLNTEGFLQLEHRFNDDWRLKVSGTYQNSHDPITEAILGGSISPGSTGNYIEAERQDTDNGRTQYAADATLTGATTLLGFKQKFVISADYSRDREFSNSLGAFTSVIVNPFDFDPNSLSPEPAQTADNVFDLKFANTQIGANARLILQPLENLHITGGFRYSDERNSRAADQEFGGLPPSDSTQAQRYYGVFTPSATATYDLRKWLSVYGSYADIFTVQPFEYMANGQPIPPETGETFETGLRARLLGGKLNGSIALYYANERNVGLFASSSGGSFGENAGCCYVDTGAEKSDGVDVELTGEVAPGLQVQAGYTYNNNRFNSAAYVYNAGFSPGQSASFQTQQPHHQFKLFTSYALPAKLSSWTVGGGLRVESSRSASGFVCNLALDPTGFCDGGSFVPFSFSQAPYVVLDFRVAYRLDAHWEASLNVTNINDARYYDTIGTSDGNNYYGQPRAFMFALRAKY